MNENIERIRRGWGRFITEPHVMESVRRLKDGVTFFWMLFGMIPGWVLMSALFVYSGLWDMYIIARGNPITSGMDIITSNTDAQLILAFGIITFGLLLAMTRNEYLLTLAAILVLVYVVYVARGTWTGVIDLRGWRAVMYLLVGGIGVIVANYSSYQHIEEQAANARLEDEILEVRAEIAGYNQTIRMLQAENRRLSGYERERESIPR